MNEKLTLREFNERIRKTLDHYYEHHDADSFFEIDHFLRLCQKYGMTGLEVPALVEMQNVIVMG